jgi:putative hydrolase of HD superfamily
MSKYLDFFHQVGKLKDLKRQGWVIKGVKEPESVADHSFRLGVMALVLAPRLGLDSSKCIKLALIHDVAESIVGDITPHDNVSKSDKSALEERAILKMFKGLDDEGSFLTLWKEYENKESKEALFVKELDKFETLIQAFEYEKKNESYDLEEFWDKSDSLIKNDLLKGFVDDLKNKR